VKNDKKHFMGEKKNTKKTQLKAHQRLLICEGPTTLLVATVSTTFLTNLSESEDETCNASWSERT
jgi:hypothetical protein